MAGKLNEAYRVWYTLKLTSGAPATGVAGGDQTITIRNPQNTATMAAPTITEFGGGLYFFDISATFTNTHGAGQYGGTIEVNSAAPVIVDTLPVNVDFFVIDTDDLIDSKYDSPIGPAVWIDQYYGTTGTVPGIHGTASNPVNNEADAYTLAVALGFRRTFIHAGTITLTSGSSIAYQDWTFGGSGFVTGIDIGGKNVWGATFYRTSILGTFDPVGNEGNDIQAFDCWVGACTNITGTLNDCWIHSTLALPTVVIFGGAAGSLILKNCANWNPINFPARITYGGAAADNTSVRLRGYKGKLLIQNMAQSGQVLEGDFDGCDLEFENTCTAGVDPILTGVFKLTDNSTGLTMDTSGRIGEINDVHLGATHGAGSWVGSGLTTTAIDNALSAAHGSGSWETAISTSTQETLEGHSVTQMNANPGQTVTITTQILDSNGERIDGYVPQIDYLINPAGAMASGFPSNMSRDAAGLYSQSVAIPTGLTAIGTYIVSVSWLRPGTAFRQYEVHLINTSLPFGSATGTPA